MTVQLLLKWNGYHLKLQTGELADMFIAIADGSANEQELLFWIQSHLG
jgi:death-on-curing protein